MDHHSSIFFIIEAIGTIAFTISGALVAIKKQLDLLGIIVLGVITAVGGGMLRDILIGNVPPVLFINPTYAAMAFITVILIFFIVRFHPHIMDSQYMKKFEKVISVFDAVGLGAFTVTGVDTAMSAGYDKYPFLVIFLGVITGVGGGILRDILAGQPPLVLRKHVYACASIAGAVSCRFLMKVISHNAAVILSAVLVVLIRLLAAHFCWNLPAAVPKQKRQGQKCEDLSDD